MDMTFFIKVQYQGQTRTIGLDKDEVTIGRSTPKDIVDLDLNPDNQVSRKHVVLSIEYDMADNKFAPWIKDMGSSKGTFVNGEQLDAPMKICKDDEIRIGETLLCIDLVRKDKEAKEERPKPQVPGKPQVVREQGSPAEAGPKKPPAKGGPGGQGDPDKKPTPKPPPDTSGKSITQPNEAAGFVAFSVEDLATAINRYARENKMQPIQTTMTQEGEGAKASFRGLTIFASQN